MTVNDTEREREKGAKEGRQRGRERKKRVGIGGIKNRGEKDSPSTNSCPPN